MRDFIPGFLLPTWFLQHLQNILTTGCVTSGEITPAASLVTAKDVQKQPDSNRMENYTASYLARSRVGSGDRDQPQSEHFSDLQELWLMHFCRLDGSSDQPQSSDFR